MSEVSDALAALAAAKAALAGAEESLTAELLAAKKSGDADEVRRLKYELRDVRAVVREGRTELVGGDAVKDVG